MSRKFFIPAFLALFVIVAPVPAQFPAAISPPESIPTNGGGGTYVASDGAGNWVAVWTSNDDMNNTIGSDLDVLVSRSADNGLTWSNPVPLNTNAGPDSGGDFSPQVATDGAGNWVAVWSSRNILGGGMGTDSDIHVSRSTDNGATWTPPAALNTNATTDMGNDSSPQIATDRLGNWLAVWSSQEALGVTGTDSDIFFARSVNNGVTWTPPQPLNSLATIDTGSDSAPAIATDTQQNWIAVWDSSENFAGIGPDRNIFVARSSDNGATWTPQAPLNSNAATDTGNDSDPWIATDRLGNWVAVWHSNPGGDVGSDFDVFVTRSEDNGATWSALVPLNSLATSDSGGDVDARVASDGHGHWVAVWESTEPQSGVGTDGDILVALSTDNGLSWTSAVPLNGNAATDADLDQDPQIASDGQGHWIGSWAADKSPSGIAGIVVARFALPDCNLNGVLDGEDIAIGFSADCNANGVPDSCEADSDGDGVIDACTTVAPSQPSPVCGTCAPGMPVFLGVVSFMLVRLRIARRSSRMQAE